MVPVKREWHSVTWVYHTEPVQGYGFANYLNSSPEQKEMVNLEGRACPWDGSSVQFSLVTQSCPILCDPMDCSMTGLPVHHQLPEFTQIHVHWIGDAIQPSHPLSSPSPPAFNLSPHQGLFQGVRSLHQVMQSIGVSASTSVLPVNIQDWFPLGWTGWISLQSKGLSRVFSNTTVQKQWGYLINYEGLLRNSM